MRVRLPKTNRHLAALQQQPFTHRQYGKHVRKSRCMHGSTSE
jgi:hypothetical protein